jgi:hypothetical protein
MEDRIPIIQVLDPYTQEELALIYGTDDWEFCKKYKLSLSEIMDRYGDLLTEEQKTKLRNYGK